MTALNKLHYDSQAISLNHRANSRFCRGVTGALHMNEILWKSTVRWCLACLPVVSPVKTLPQHFTRLNPGHHYAFNSLSSRVPPLALVSLPETPCLQIARSKST